MLFTTLQLFLVFQLFVTTQQIIFAARQKSIDSIRLIYIYMQQLIIIVSPEQIKKNRLSLPLWDIPIHILGFCNCSQSSETDNQTLPLLVQSISLGTKWIKVYSFFPALHLDCFQCLVTINNTGIGIFVHMYIYPCSTNILLRVDSQN